MLVVVTIVVLVQLQSSPTIKNLITGNKEKADEMLENLRETAIADKNLFESLMEVTKYCSIGQITNTLYNVGGKYRRNM